MTFEELRTQASTCNKCALCESRKNVVFGVGNEHADIMLVGEAPGEQEDLLGEPFVGRSGKLMDQMLEYCGLSRKTNIYIGNMIKCRPPQNRDPLPNEIECCHSYLQQQIELISPKVIVCVGRIAACSLIKPDFKVTLEHGQFFEKDDRLYMGTFHPAALLRNPNNKPEAMKDLLLLRDFLQENDYLD